MKHRTFLSGILVATFVTSVAAPRTAFAQAALTRVQAVLAENLLPPAVADFELRQFIVEHVAAPPQASSADAWTARARELRRHLLNDVVFHGWPSEWTKAPLKFEDLGVFFTAADYRMRKLRIEVVPGFQTTGILYEPKELRANTPAILNVNGHEYKEGKAIEYKQKRCITLAQHGILALSLEWLGTGELNVPENAHRNGSALDLVGMNTLGLFYLEMRCGLDYLMQHPNVDRSRVGVTGLSGGGWQTIFLAALDERVTAAVPVSGFGATGPKTTLYRYGNWGDIEQNPTDGFAGVDYSDLVALVAPRPMLLINSSEDDCCFRAPAVKPLNYDAIKPIYKLYGQADALSWHENSDPGTHNYQLDNRRAAYRFFSSTFHLPSFEENAGVAAEIKSYEELVVGLPKDNLTILGLARKAAEQIRRAPMPEDQQARAQWASAERDKLTRVVRMEPATIMYPWVVSTTKNKGVGTFSYVFRMKNALSANAVLIAAIERASPSSVTIVLDDDGKAGAADIVTDRVNRGDAVLALDLLFMGDAWSPPANTTALYRPATPAAYNGILQTLGHRSLGLQAGQLLAIAHWMAAKEGNARIRLECRGIRSEVMGLVAAAADPDLFSEVRIRDGMKSLGYLLTKPISAQNAPELFCLDLYRDFDLDRLAYIAAPTKIKFETLVDEDRHGLSSLSSRRME